VLGELELHRDGEMGSSSSLAKAAELCPVRAGSPGWEGLAGLGSLGACCYQGSQVRARGLRHPRAGGLRRRPHVNGRCGHRVGSQAAQNGGTVGRGVDVQVLDAACGGHAGRGRQPAPGRCRAATPRPSRNCRTASAAVAGGPDGPDPRRSMCSCRRGTGRRPGTPSAPPARSCRHHEGNTVLWPCSRSVAKSEL
jgi:hypothetical protein